MMPKRTKTKKRRAQASSAQTTEDGPQLYIGDFWLRRGGQYRVYAAVDPEHAGRLDLSRSRFSLSRNYPDSESGKDIAAGDRLDTDDPRLTRHPANWTDQDCAEATAKAAQLWRHAKQKALDSVASDG